TCPTRTLNFRIKLKESVQRLFKLRPNFLFPALQQMHGDMRFFFVLQADFGLADSFDLIGGQEPHSVNQRKFSHGSTIALSRTPASHRTRHWAASRASRC